MIDPGARPRRRQHAERQRDRNGDDEAEQRQFGRSRQAVADFGRNRLPASAELTLVGLLLAMSIALPLGVLAAVRQGSWIDHLCRIVTTAGVSLPVFFTGLLLVYVFYFLLGWAPAPLGRLDVFFSAPPR